MPSPLDPPVVRQACPRPSQRGGRGAHRERGLDVKTALIGHTGFVGGNLLRQTAFDDLYASANIADIRGREYDLVVCAAPSSVKWLANQRPDEDLAHMERLMDDLRHCRAETFVLTSTVDIYPEPVGVDEDTPIDPERAQPYGRHRFYLEEFCRGHFSRTCVVRFPHLYGPGIRKNFVYDLIHRNALHLTHRDSVLQFYDLTDLWRDLAPVIDLGLPLVNFSTEPIRTGDLARECFGMEFDTVTEAPPLRYDMLSRHGETLGWGGERLQTRSDTFRRVRALAETEAGESAG